MTLEILPPPSKGTLEPCKDYLGFRVARPAPIVAGSFLSSFLCVVAVAFLAAAGTGLALLLGEHGHCSSDPHAPCNPNPWTP